MVDVRTSQEMSDLLARNRWYIELHRLSQSPFPFSAVFNRNVLPMLSDIPVLLIGVCTLIFYHTLYLETENHSVPSS